MVLVTLLLRAGVVVALNIMERLAVVELVVLLLFLQVFLLELHTL